MRSVRRSDTHEDLVRRLSEEQHKVLKKTIFPTMRELMCFAAVLGYHEGRRTPLEGKTNDIDGRVFSNLQQAVDLVYLIALVEKKDVMILHDDNEDEMLTIFEEYANTGFYVLDQWMNEKPDDNFGDKAILTAFYQHNFLENKDGHGEKGLGEVTF